MSLQAAIEAYRRGDPAEARRLALPVAQEEPSNEQAWLLLMLVGQDEAERAQAAQRVLAINPHNSHARQYLQAATPPAGQPSPTLEEDGRRVYQEGVYEMLWDCQYCGTAKLLGKTHRFCPNCGAAQNPDSRYYPADEEKIAVQDHVYVGADKICPACQGLNSASAEFCGQCGAPLSEAARARQMEAQTRAMGARFESSGSRDIAQERFDAEMERVGVRPRAAAGARGRGRNPLLIGGLIALVAVIVIGVGLALFWNREAGVYVVGHSWQREVRVEAYGPQAEDAWCSDMPADAYGVSRRQEVHHYNQIPDGEDCQMRRVDQGDGTFREERVCETRYREEPVYADRCYYTVDRWRYARSAAASGDSLSDAPYWPTTGLACEGQARHGCEREAPGGRSERYTLHLRAADGDTTYRCDVDQALWQSAGIESRWTLAVNVVTGLPRCESLQPAG